MTKTLKEIALEEYEKVTGIKLIEGMQRVVLDYTTNVIAAYLAENAEPVATCDKERHELWWADGFPERLPNGRHKLYLHPASEADKIDAEQLHTFINAAAGDGLVLDGIDAAELYVRLFPERYAKAISSIDTGVIDDAKKGTK